MAKSTTTLKPMNENHGVLPWDKIDPDKRKDGIWYLWLVTWGLLLLGYWKPSAWKLAVQFSGLHALLFLGLFHGNVHAFPVQVRIAYALWVWVGAYVPRMEFLMWITTVGLATNLFMEYCPLARIMTLFPWNRDEPLSLRLLRRTFLSPPSKGKFQAAKSE